LDSLKRALNNFSMKFGYKIIRTNSEHRGPVFNNFLNLIGSYEYLFNQIRCHELIQPNGIRAEIASRLLGTPPSEAFFIIEAIAKTNLIEGAVCEFGVAQGETSALIANEIRKSNKIFHLFDSFEGLPKPTVKDKLKDDIFKLGSMEAYEGTMNCNERLVTQRLKDISFDSKRYVIHKGFIEKIIHEDRLLPEKVSFAYIDFDFYEPILVTLNYLHEIIPNGGIFIVDDYNFFSTGVKTAVDEFINDKNKVEKYYDVEVPDKTFGHFAILNKIK
jgi:O-methyltransferase